jgi:hypothetical protein
MLAAGLRLSATGLSLGERFDAAPPRIVDNILLSLAQDGFVEQFMRDAIELDDAAAVGWFQTGVGKVSKLDPLGWSNAVMRLGATGEEREVFERLAQHTPSFGRVLNFVVCVESAGAKLHGFRYYVKGCTITRHSDCVGQSARQRYVATLMSDCEKQHAVKFQACALDKSGASVTHAALLQVYASAVLTLPPNGAYVMGPVASGQQAAIDGVMSVHHEPAPAPCDSFTMVLDFGSGVDVDVALAKIEADFLGK